MRHSPPRRIRPPALAAALLLAVTGALAGPGASPAQAQTEHAIYVSPDRQRQRPGTADQPLATLTEAQKRAGRPPPQATATSPSSSWTGPTG